MTSTIIILAIQFILLLLTVAEAVRLHYYCNRLFLDNRALRFKLNACNDAANDPAPVYTVQRVDTDSPLLRHCNGNWSICRKTAKRGYLFPSIIKVFHDGDDDSNYRKAKEICDLLNSK